MAPLTATERPDVDDDEIIHDIRVGNLARAFERVMHRYEAKVYRLCIAFVRNPIQAQDIAQDSLVRIWRALPTYDGRAALSTWIYAITRNGCLTFLSRRRDTVSLSDAPVQVEVDSLTALDVQTSADESQALRQLVEALPDVARRIVILYYFEERAVSEVSRMVGLAEGTIKTHLFRARAQLLTRLKSLGWASPAHWAVMGDRYDP